MALPALSFAAPALAHGADGAASLHWIWEPWVLFCLALATLPYLAGLWRMGAERRRIVGPWRVASFLAGIALLLVTLESPLDGLADALFSAHMAQHMLLIFAVPPLLVVGRPVAAWLWAFDLPRRRTLVAGWRRAGLYATFRRLTRPLTVWVILVGALCFWHIPGPYGWALAHGWAHDLEHLSFIGAGLAYWTVVIEPYGRRRALSYGMTIVYVVSIGFVMGMIGAILTFASTPLYTAQLATTAAFGLTPVADQQLAGAIMWVPAELIQLTALTVLAYAWLRENERRASHLRTVLPSSATTLRCLAAVPIALVLVAALTGCGRSGGDPSPAHRHYQSETAGSPQRGKKMIMHYGCGSCHLIPGVPNARGLVGPPLTHWSERNFIAGLLRNDPDNLVHWIRFPQSVVPGVDMPNLGVTKQDARDIAAYLYTIH